MSEHAVYLQPAFILYARKYRETSLILDTLTEEFGRVSVLAKGVKRLRSKTAGLLQPFVPLIMSFTGKKDLKTLLEVEINPPQPGLQGIPLYCGFYLNELISLFLHPYDPHPEIFRDYRESLYRLSENTPVEKVLRLFEIKLLENSGYGLQLQHDSRSGQSVVAKKQYQYFPGEGPVELLSGPYSGITLLALADRELDDQPVLTEAKQLIRSVIQYHFPEKELKSRTLITQIIKKTKTGFHA